MLIVVWLALSLLAQRLQALALLFLCAALFVLSLKLNAALLLRLLRRTRWILFSLLLIYAYTTPGAGVWQQLGVLSPTREGLLDGVLQLGRLLSVLSGLAVLLAMLSQTELISGLYTLAYPLRWFGLSRERIAVRLALTLEFAESAMSDTASDWRATLRDALAPSISNAAQVEVRLQSFCAVDYLLLAATAALLMGVWR